ncbi:hypothetical protein MMC26_007330 [Xylographa opegraphella]|nr:hypothetical protein [Xylographa opegraphella]
MYVRTEDEAEGNFFAVPELWKPSVFAANADHFINSSVENIFGCNETSFGFSNEAKLVLPDLENFQYGSFEDLSRSESSSISLNDENLEGSIPEVTEDVWAFSGVVDPLPHAQEPRTWERFYNRDAIEKSPYLSEAGPRAFDAALVAGIYTGSAEDDTLETRIVQSDPLLAALVQLGMGRASTMFAYDAGKQSFRSNFGHLRMSGYSEESFQSLTDVFIEHGNRFVSLACFVEMVYAQNSPPATLVATAATVSSLSSVLLRYLGDASTDLRSVLQLQALFAKVGKILHYLSKLIKELPMAKTDAEILSVVYRCCQELEQSEPWLRATFEHVLSRVSKPWLGSVSSYMGLNEYTSTSCDTALLLHTQGIEVEAESRHKIPKLQVMPNFIVKEDGEKLLETHNSLDLLRKHCSNHILTSSVKSHFSDPPRLEWHFTWTDIERIEAKAKAYEANVLEAMTGNRSVQNLSTAANDTVTGRSDSELDPFMIPDGLLRSDRLDSDNIFELSLSKQRQAVKSDALEDYLVCVLNEKTFSDLASSASVPPLSVTPLISFSPIISAQARMINLACLRLLLKEHNLLDHLRLQWHFHLFGDGVFASRISQALFDPELESAERRKGYRRIGKIGLKLGTRSSWPPASSELRIALMGILSECYNSSALASNEKGSSDLPGGLSFAIRDISEAEIKRCMDPDSIEALDFLRLQYKAPSPLDAVLTTSLLEKYDTIFKLLLRVKRMLFVVSQLASDVRSRARRKIHINLFTKQYSFEAHHFVTTINEYFFAVAIGSNWSGFESDIADIERKLDNDETAYLISSHEGIHKLHIRHEEVLNCMLFGLLLRKRQAHAMMVLEEIFRTILRFVKTKPETDADQLRGLPSTNSKQDMYHQFRNNVRIFIEVCKGLSDKQARSTARQSAVQRGASNIDRLLLRLGMNDYYSRPINSITDTDLVVACRFPFLHLKDTLRGRNYS